jgi:hypothetical protein
MERPPALIDQSLLMVLFQIGEGIQLFNYLIDPAGHNAHQVIFSGHG